MCQLAEESLAGLSGLDRSSDRDGGCCRSVCRIGS